MQYWQKLIRNNLFNFITLNKDNFFFKLKKIFLLTTLHMYLCDFTDINFFNLKEKNNQEIFSNRIAMDKLV